MIFFLKETSSLLIQTQTRFFHFGLKHYWNLTIVMHVYIHTAFTLLYISPDISLNRKTDIRERFLNLTRHSICVLLKLSVIPKKRITNRVDSENRRLPTNHELMRFNASWWQLACAHANFFYFFILRTKTERLEKE